MTEEWDLPCATCGGELTRRSVAPETTDAEDTEPVALAVCTDCGSRYYPDRTLRDL